MSNREASFEFISRSNQILDISRLGLLLVVLNESNYYDNNENIFQ